jgi:hypothetical protein
MDILHTDALWTIFTSKWILSVTPSAAQEATGCYSDIQVQLYGQGTVVHLQTINHGQIVLAEMYLQKKKM